MAIVKKTQNVGKDVRKGDTYIVCRNETGRATVENCMEIPKKKKNLPAVQETQVWSLGRKDALEKEMTIHSSIPA